MLYHKTGCQTQISLSEHVFLTGNLNALQNWSPENALALSSAKYPTWSGKHLLVSMKSVSLPFQLLFRFQQTRTSSTNTFASTTVVLPGRRIQTMSTLLPLLATTLLMIHGDHKQSLFCIFESEQISEWFSHCFVQGPLYPDCLLFAKQRERD